MFRFPSPENSISSQSNSSQQLQVYYVANNNIGTKRNQRRDDHSERRVSSQQRLNRSVTFAMPVVSNVREIEALNRPQCASPILAGHPSIYPALNGGGPAVCRICYSSENSGPKTGEPLISPCHCKGTMGLYHRTCLNKWLAVSNKTSCEICRFRFQTKRVKRNFCEYLRDEDSTTSRRTMVTDLLCFLLLTPLVLISSVVCSFSAFKLLKADNQEGDGDKSPANDLDGAIIATGLPFEIAMALLFLSVVLLIAYCIWLGVTITFHRKAFHRWQATHLNCIIMDQLSLEESMLINGFC